MSCSLRSSFLERFTPRYSAATARSAESLTCSSIGTWLDINHLSNGLCGRADAVRDQRSACRPTRPFQDFTVLTRADRRDMSVSYVSQPRRLLIRAFRQAAITAYPLRFLTSRGSQLTQRVHHLWEFSKLF